MTLAEHRALTSSNPILSQPQLRRQGGLKTAVQDRRAGNAPARERSSVGGLMTRDQGGDSAVPPPSPSPLPSPPLAVADLMTMDGVVNRTAAALGLTFLTAVLSWTALPPGRIGAAVSCAIVLGSGAVAGALVVAQRRRKLSSRVRVLAFALVQGVLLGELSGVLSGWVSPGLFVALVLGTMAACAGALLAYKLHWLKVSHRRTGFAGAALIGVCLQAAADWYLHPLLGTEALGLRPLGPGMLMAAAGIVLGACFLPLHFGQVDEGIRHGVPGDRTWQAAFGLALLPAWLYVETARLFTVLPRDDYPVALL